MKRCEARSPDGDQCGDYEGHDGNHTKLIASEFLRPAALPHEDHERHIRRRIDAHDAANEPAVPVLPDEEATQGEELDVLGAGAGATPLPVCPTCDGDGVVPADCDSFGYAEVPCPTCRAPSSVRDSGGAPTLERVARNFVDLGFRAMKPDDVAYWIGEFATALRASSPRAPTPAGSGMSEDVMDALELSSTARMLDEYAEMKREAGFDHRADAAIRRAAFLRAIASRLSAPDSAREAKRINSSLLTKEEK